GQEITFTFRGSGFLYNMVRIIVGVLLDVGQGKRKPSDITALMEKRDRRLVGETVPPQGLYLWNVKYEEYLIENMQEDLTNRLNLIYYDLWQFISKPRLAPESNCVEI